VRIVDIQLESLVRRVAARRMRLEVTDATKARLATQGLVPGVRRRPLSASSSSRSATPRLALLEGKFNEGDTVVVDVEGDEVVLRKG